MTVNLSHLHSRLTRYLFDNSIENLENFYCPLKETYDWRNDSKTIKTESGSDFETKIRTFFVRDSKSPDADNVRVIIGGIGTGKSTTVQRVLKNLFDGEFLCKHSTREDLHCDHKPLVLYLDFELTKEEESHRNTDLKSLDAFWSSVTSNIETTGAINFDSGMREIVDFLLWCLTQKKLLANSILIHKFLEAEKQTLFEFQNKAALRSELGKTIKYTLNILLSNMSAQDFCWYIVFKFKYQLFVYDKSRCNCVYVILDNVDHLNPDTQTTAVSFAINLSEILSAKTIITIRPLTWERSTHAHTLVDVLYQYSPVVTDVIEKRVDWFIKNESISAAEEKVLKSLVNQLIGKTRHYNPLSNLLKATSGISVRFGLRNFANMLESNIFSNIEVEEYDFDILDKFKIWQIARAFLFGNRDHILTHSFDNLYSVDKSKSAPLLKARILDYINRICGGETEVAKVVLFCEAFKYEKEIIITALNDLLMRRRPLIWCNLGYNLRPESKTTELFGKVVITPIGKSYLADLFGALFYDEQCLAKNLNDFVDVESIIDFHSYLTDADLEDISNYCNKNSAELYRKFYPKESISLSFLHWKNLFTGIEKLSAHLDFHYDPQRLNWISKQVNNILNQSI